MLIIPRFARSFRVRTGVLTLSGLLLLGLCCISNTLAQEPAILNLNNADIRVLIDTVSKATGKNFIIDPRVKSKVTVISSREMDEDELYEVFLSILQVHGFAAIPGEDVIKIVPDVNAKQGAVPRFAPDTSDQLVTQVIALQNVPANQLVPILRPLVPQQGHLAAYAPTNVLVITDRASNISRLMGIIRNIDRPDNEEIEMVRLEHASATEIVRIINSLQQQGGKNEVAGNRPNLAADERTNSILLTGDKATRMRILSIITQLDTPLEASGNTRVIFLRYANAEELVSILQGISSNTLEQNKGNAGNRRPEVDIQADETNNALVITAPPNITQQLEIIIRRLDIPRAQVLIEAIIAEVSSDLAIELGTQFLIDGSGDGKGPIGGIIFNEAGNLGSILEGDVSGIADGITMALGDTTGSNQFAFILRALKGDAATNILSTPTLVTLDNVEAEIVFGQNVPFVTGSFTSTGSGDGSTNPFQTIEREDVGLTLKVKPQINEGNAIKLEIEQEISSINSSAIASDVVTNKRAIKTHVLVEDGQTVVLGGLIEDRFTDTKRKVPGLGSIPGLGHLFSYTRTQKIKSNLMVFIRPVILRDNLSSNFYTSNKYSQLRAQQIDAKISERGLLRKTKTELPNIELLLAPQPTPAVTPDQNSNSLPQIDTLPATTDTPEVVEPVPVAPAESNPTSSIESNDKATFTIIPTETVVAPEPVQQPAPGSARSSSRPKRVKSTSPPTAAEVENDWGVAEAPFSDNSGNVDSGLESVSNNPVESESSEPLMRIP